MKGLLYGILLIIIVGLGGFLYKNAVDYPTQPVACPVGALTCPDGTTVSRIGSSCVFPACPAPNVSFPEADLAFAVPEGFVPVEPEDAAVIAQYEVPAAGLSPAVIAVRRYAIAASSTALATIQATAIGGASGLPIPATQLTSTVIAGHRFTVANIERFEAIINTAYYLSRGTDVLRFDAIDRDVYNWTEPSLDVNSLPAHAALRKLLSTLQ